MIGCSNSNPKFGYLSLHINPRVDILLDDSRVVDHYVLLNEEAEILLAGEDLKGLTVEETIELVLDQAVKTGYIDVFSADNVVSVFATDGGEDDLQTLAESKIASFLSERAIAAAVVAQIDVDAAIERIAEELDVSTLQAKMIQTYRELAPSISDDGSDFNLEELAESLGELFDASLGAFETADEASAIILQDRYITDLSDVLFLFAQNVANGTITLPDLTGLKERFLTNYASEVAKIQTRNQERSAFVAAETAGSVNEYLIGDFEFALSSNNWPYIVNYYDISFAENGTYFENWSVTSRFDGQTMTSNYIGNWNVADGQLSLSGSPLFRFFVSNGRIGAYNQDDELILFNKIS
jgi:hypothetical protein